jgi:Raf kinase inhibitor-like YbhB/YbcL family protein
MSPRGTRRRSLAIAAAVAAALLGGEAVAAQPFQLTSPAFGAGEEIPSRFTCEGDDISPPLAWSAPPAGTKSFALVIDDPDAPDPKAPRTTWVHWVVYNLPADARELREGAGGALPGGARTGTNDWKRADYGGPCPPIGRHRYFHKLYALDVVLPDRGTLTKAELERVTSGHVLSRAELIGTYEKRR